MDGTKFDSSRDRGEPFPVENVGQAGVIAGWNEGLQGMKQGGHRVLVIPPGLGYGEAGFGGGVIPPNAWLVFKVELVEVR
jgi:FKBP-type peptidyl-prolyl cis-trans isomerase